MTWGWVEAEKDHLGGNLSLSAGGSGSCYKRLFVLFSELINPELVVELIGWSTLHIEP